MSVLAWLNCTRCDTESEVCVLVNTEKVTVECMKVDKWCIVVDGWSVCHIWVPVSSSMVEILCVMSCYVTSLPTSLCSSWLQWMTTSHLSHSVQQIPLSNQLLLSCNQQDLPQDTFGVFTKMDAFLCAQIDGHAISQVQPQPPQMCILLCGWQSVFLADTNSIGHRAQDCCHQHCCLLMFFHWKMQRCSPWDHGHDLETGILRFWSWHFWSWSRSQRTSLGCFRDRSIIC